MHRSGPLEPDDCPFQSRQKVKRQRHTSNSENREQHQRFWPPGGERDVQSRCHDMPDNQDRQIRRPVIRTCMAQIFTAYRAGRPQLEIAFQDRPRTAIGTFAPEPLPDRRPQGAVIRNIRGVGLISHVGRRLLYVSCSYTANMPKGEMRQNAHASACREQHSQSSRFFATETGSPSV